MKTKALQHTTWTARLRYAQRLPMLGASTGAARLWTKRKNEKTLLDIIVMPKDFVMPNWCYMLALGSGGASATDCPGMVVVDEDPRIY